MRSAGSSPRVRGTRSASPWQWAAWTVHPRVCGELRLATGGGTLKAGSSPRVRGTPERPRHRGLQHRFIPACAGNSWPGRSSPPPPAVHPRVCGELAEDGATLLAAAGSSPRVRGTPHAQGGDGSDRRFIPRVRGTRESGSDDGALFRFIPACAGNSPSTRFSTRCAAVHPRVCGELAVDGGRAAGAGGSSPRVRGTPKSTRWTFPPLRFIPACAGNSQRSPLARTTASVHPRVCGELDRYTRFCALKTGSSPRVRGTRPRVRPRAGLGRFIPACAGNSMARETGESE